MTPWIETLRSGVHIHKVEEFAFAHAFLFLCNVDEPMVHVGQTTFFVRELELLSTAECVDAPVIKDCGAAIASAESLDIHPFLSILLAFEEHKRIAT